MPTPPRPRNRKRWALAALSVLAIVAILAAILSRPTALPPPQIPNPNGYDLLVHAGRIIEGPPPNEGKIAEADLEELRAWVLANESVLDLAGPALDMPSAVPLRYTQDDLERTMPDSGPLRMLARLLLADVLVARAEGRIDDAARRSLDAYRLAHQSSRHGLLIHVLIGVAIERMAGHDGLRPLLDDLDDEQSLAIARQLLSIDASQPDADEVIARDYAWSARTMPRSLRISRAIVPGVETTLRTLAAPGEASFRDALLAASLDRRRLATDLAVRAYRQRHDGALPARLDDLVPEYLPHIPLHPGTDQPPFYELDPAGDGYILEYLGAEEDDLDAASS